MPKVIGHRVPDEELAALRAEGLSQRAIGEQLGLTQQGVSWRLQRAEPVVQEMVAAKTTALRAGIQGRVELAFQVIDNALRGRKTPPYVKTRVAVEVLRMAALLERMPPELSADGMPDPLAGLDALEAACEAALGVSTSGAPDGAIGGLPESTGAVMGDRTDAAL